MTTAGRPILTTLKQGTEGRALPWGQTVEPLQRGLRQGLFSTPASPWRWRLSLLARIVDAPIAAQALGLLSMLLPGRPRLGPADARVRIDLLDCREWPGSEPLEKTAPIGVFDPVGPARVLASVAKLRRLVAPSGRLLNHGISAGGARNAQFST